LIHPLEFLFKKLLPGPSNVSLPFHRRRRATFHEKNPISSSTDGKENFEFGEADLTEPPSE
jgi:hypothetical protein